MDDDTALSSTPLDGWDEVAPGAGAGGPAPLGDDDLRRFYDGGSPDWAVARAPAYQVPRRKVVADAVAMLRAPVSPAMVLLVGAAGDGRSTVLRQVALDLAAAGQRVLFRHEGTPLDGDAVAGLPGAATGTAWILASDDADEVAWDLEPLIERLIKEGRRDVHWLLTARDADWDAEFRANGRSVEPQWDRHVEAWPRRMARAQALPLTADDAAGVVVAWESADRLGALAAVPPADRAAALLETAQARPGQSFSGGTILGAALDCRFGAEGLSAHVRASMERLAPDAPMLDAFMYAAAAGAVGIDGVDLRVVAGLVGVDVERRREIRTRLAEDGLATGGREALRARHGAIARAATLLAAEGVAGVDLDQVFVDLVRGTGELGKTVRPLVSDGAVMTVAPALADRLQRIGVAADVAGRVARAAADQAARTLPDLLVFVIARGRTYLNVGQPAEGSAILRAAVDGAGEREDWERVGRNYLYEMSLCEGQVGRPVESLLLAAMSVSDGKGLGPITTMDAQLAFTGLGTAVSAMDESVRDERYQRLLRGSAHMSRFVTPKWDQPARLRFKAFAEAADEQGVPECSTTVALGWLAEAVASATSGLAPGDELVALWSCLFPDDAPATFKVLEKALATR